MIIIVSISDDDEERIGNKSLLLYVKYVYCFSSYMCTNISEKEVRRKKKGMDENICGGKRERERRNRAE